MTATALSIVIPVYNEGANFAALWAALRSHIHCDFEAIVVYDFDEDNTLPVAREIIDAGETRIRLVKNDVRRGVIGAILCGFNRVESRPVLVVMGDLSDDLSQVDKMLALYEQGNQLVCASRYMKGGRTIGGPRFKQNLSRAAGLTLHWLRGIPTHDATNAFKLYDRGMLKALTITSRGGFELGLEITVKAFLAGYRIAELPAVWRDRTGGESQFKFWGWMPHYLKWYLYAFRPRRRCAAVVSQEEPAEDFNTLSERPGMKGN